MARHSLEDELRDLQKRERENARRQRAVNSQLKERERKRRSTMLVAYGLLVLDELERGVRRKDALMQDLNRVLRQPSHRAAVGLPPRNEPAPENDP
jgi:hypothetical protein